MLTNGQKRALHAAARRLGLPEDVRRMVQWNAGGFYSAADRTASREGFIAVMAVYEQRAGGRMPGCTPGYWQDEDRKANPSDGLRHLVRQAAAELGVDPDRFIAGERMSRGACDGLPQPGHDLWAYLFHLLVIFAPSFPRNRPSVVVQGPVDRDRHARW